MGDFEGDKVQEQQQELPGNLKAPPNSTDIFMLMLLRWSIKRPCRMKANGDGWPRLSRNNIGRAQLYNCR